VPERMRGLPRHPQSNFIVPYFVPVVDGVPDLKLLDERKQLHCIKHRLCGICGEPIADAHIDWNVLNFVRIKWGGLGHGQPSYMAFDLTLFGQLAQLTPKPDDWAVLQRILTLAATQFPAARPDHLERAIGKMLPSNRHERRVLLQILGYAGILRPRDTVPLLDRFVPYAQRRSETELGYPFAAWRGADGVDREAVHFWFPEITGDRL